MQLSAAIVDFDLFYDEPVDMQMWVSLTRSQCRVPDTQVTVKALFRIHIESENCKVIHFSFLITGIVSIPQMSH